MEAKHGLFFNIGLVVSLAAVVGMMEWKTFDRDGELALGSVTSDFEEVMDIPVTEQPPPPPPQQQIKNINIIEVPDVEGGERIEWGFPTAAAAIPFALRPGRW